MEHELDIIISDKGDKMTDQDNLEFNKNTRYIKLYCDVIEALSKELTDAEFVFMVRLSNFISNEDCIVRNGGRCNGTVLMQKDLSKLMDINYSTIRRLTSELVKKDIIKFTKVKCRDKENIQIKAIVCNPWILSRGMKIDKTILALFENTKWKDLCSPKSDDRLSYEYSLWKNSVLERDGYTCQCCGSTEELEVHHKENYMGNIDLRLKTDNGITLCRNCHNTKVKGSFHNLYGTKNNTKEQLEEYLHNKKLESI